MTVTCATWNLNGALFAGPTETGGNSLSAGLDHVAAVLRAISPDVVCLQEVPCGSNELPETEAAFAALAEYPHRVLRSLSPSHVRNGGRLGLAILSKYPIVDNDLVCLPAPDLKYVAEDGSLSPLHDKGILRASVVMPSGAVTVLCAHLHPFKRQRRRPGEPIFDAVRSAFKATLILAARSPLLLCADLNMDNLDEFTPGLSAELHLSNLIDTPTHWINGAYVRSDHIMCSRHWGLAHARVFPTRFDHDLCLATLTPLLSGVQVSDVYRAMKRNHTDGFTVMHLSDLHYGTGSQGDVDWKVWINGAERTQRVDRLREFIDHLPINPDFVVVSGDITIAGDPKGFADFEQVLLNGIRNRRLPDARHTIIVPGNHDVSRKTNPRSKQRWDDFQQRFGAHFVVPWLPTQEAPDRLLDRLRRQPLEDLPIIGGANQVVDPLTGLPETLPLPFTFDRRRKVLFYAFNSSLIAGSQLDAGAKLDKFLSSLEEVGDAPPNLAALKEDLSALRQVDPSRIEPTELSLFHGVVDVLRRRLPDEFHGSIKVAVLHHHVVPFIPEEVKQFELLLNAGQFKKQLVDAGFQVVMHGHKHWPDMVLDTALAAGGQLLVVSGGTIGGGPSEGKPGFNWLRFELNDQQFSVSRHFIPVGPDSVDDAISASLSEPRQTRTLLLHRRAARRDQLERPSLARLTQSVERGLLDYMVTVPSVAPTEPVVGWNNYLGDDSISVLGTAFATLTMEAIGSRHHRYIASQPAIRRYLISMQRQNGLWSSTANFEPGQPLESCIVLDALLTISQGEALPDARGLLDALSSGAWPELLNSTCAVALFLRFALTHVPDSMTVTHLLEILRRSACRGTSDVVLGWGPSTGHDVGAASPRSENQLIGQLAPTDIHTALALWAISLARDRLGHPATLASFSTDAAVRFLLDQPWHLSAETIRESQGKELLFNHTTPVIATLALLRSGVDSRHPRIRQTVRASIDSQKEGLWDFGSIRRPSWCTLDHVHLLTAYSELSEMQDL